MLAVTVRAESAAKGASQLNERVDVLTFYTTHILPELEDPALNARAILKADCLKFVTCFRQLFSVQMMLPVCPLLISHLGGAHAVVQTYAANCLERLLNVKDRTIVGGEMSGSGSGSNLGGGGGGGGRGGGGVWVRRLGKESLRPFLNGLFTGLFGVVDRGGADGQENEYVMKAIMRLLTVVQEEILPVTGIVLDKLTASLVRVCRNPSNPLFNHFLFESVAATVKFVCQANPHATADFEERLLPPFEGVLSLDVAEFTPYVFQILAQLLLYRPDGMSAAFAALFPPLLTPSLWDRKANIPGLVLLLQAYLRKGADSLSPHIEPLLGIFTTLLSSRPSEKYAFDLLLAIFHFFPPALLSKYERRLFELILTRLQTSKSPRTIRLTLLFFGFYTGKFSPAAWSRLLESLQGGMTKLVLTQAWLPNVQMAAIAGGMEAKACVVGLTRVMCEYRELVGSAEGLEIWGGVLKGVVTMAAPEAWKEDGFGVGGKRAGEEEMDEEDAWEKQQAVQEVSGEAVFSKLHFASAGEEDYFPQVEGGREGGLVPFVAQQLNGFLAGNQGVNFWPVVEKSLSPPQIRVLQAAGVRL
jgi:exportin-2 (importin alpha re-exporter)